MASDNPQVTRPYPVRHGQSVANVTWEFSYRRVDPPLTDLGIRQARLTAEHLRSVQVDAIYSSPMLRAVQTAEIFKAALGIDFRGIEELREVDVGDLEDRAPTREAWAVHTRIHHDWADGQLDAAFPGGEDYHRLTGRALRAFAQIVGLPNGNCGITTVDVRTEGTQLVGMMDGWARRTDLDSLPQVQFPPPWETTG